jgi:3',5'-cyclic AMP phosphodiesterase CpdA
MLTRRALLRTAADTLLATGLWPGVLAAADEGDGEEFHFAVVNDVHVTDKDCVPWVEKLAAQIKGRAEAPRFLLLAGDLSEDGKADQLHPILDLFKKVQLPVYVVPGNHDYVKANDRKPYEDLFPGRLNYALSEGGWQFLALDTTEGTKAVGVKIQPPTLDWLDKELPKLDKRKPTVVFTHFPLGTLVPLRPTNAVEVLNRLKEFNLLAAFSGHFHGFTERMIEKTVLTTNRCCSFRKNNHDGSKEKGWFLCQAKAGTLARTFVEMKL